ncbi:uncharacterized protein CELE_F33D11.17 [Caenorhabditis elegans]|uniref:Uncharacterized protein n=1 Tax=Caenorhabditis elegans TaxID=6239 RepID=A0A2K5ATM7_CAEEL|nr:Uncharacterized protein CELE_F33D11.17 [Caenorhabditis elegans]SPC47126.1 Uncharacterized protein CELE_F33D11.17 [Caenorhabditis elegans]|eukprot:NP_001348674.1 Uncharacterized protein CELE_F33D11.17 [Caenorhabditis elegans]
MEGEQCVKQYR